MKVYLAGRFGRLPEIQEHAVELQQTGLITVTSRWIRGGHEWVGTPDEDIPGRDNARFAQEDLDDIDAADMLVAFTEPARSGPARGGRHVEAGYALAKDKPVLVVGHRENVFYCLPQVWFAPDWETALSWLRGIAMGHRILNDRQPSQWLTEERAS